MTSTETAVEPQPGPDDGEQAEATGISQWEFLGTVPTREDVLRLLGTLPPVWGVDTIDFADYVQALPQRKKVKTPHPERPDVMLDTYLDAFTLYMSVAGRLKMLEAAAEKNNWCVDFEPEPVTPTGLPGFLQWEQRIVYREYVAIEEPVSVDRPGNVFRRLGRKSGTAWVPATGGSNAAGSNPYEKVETSARGRAIAAWGFGVLPGSGVASVEEILGAGSNRAHLNAEAATGQGGGGRQPRKARGDLLTDALTTAEEVRQARGMTEDAMKEKVGRFLVTNLGIANAYDEESGIVRWDVVKDGQVQLLINSLRDTLAQVRAEQAAL